jgi:hypothetical protein
MLRAKEKIRGNPLDAQNLFQYDAFVLNVPGESAYDPSKPWVFKLRTKDGQIANDFFMYVDNVRTTGFSELSCWQCTRAVASAFNHLGIQDAPRKRQGPSIEPGPLQCF